MRFTDWPTVGSRRGFTLIELLIVVSVMAILVALLLPAVTTAMLKSCWRIEVLVA